MELGWDGVRLMNRIDFRRYLLFAVTLSLLGQLSVWADGKSVALTEKDTAAPRMYRKQIVSPWVRSRVLSEVSPNAIDLAIGERQVSSGPSVKLDKESEQLSAPTAVPGCGDNLGGITRWYMVTPTTSENFVAVIASVFKQPAILNPARFFVYSDIPALKSMSRKRADELWGKPIGATDSIATYKLTSTDCKGKIKEFFLDAKFGNEILEEYRLTGRELECTGWRKVEN